MIRELMRLSLTAKSIPRPIKPLVKCKIRKKKASCCFATSGGGFVLFYEPCFETFNVLFKRKLRQEEEGEERTIPADELEDQTKKPRRHN